jgi:hypothetical protein
MIPSANKESPIFTSEIVDQKVTQEPITKFEEDSDDLEKENLPELNNEQFTNSFKQLRNSMLGKNL